ncbi:hypothetical protein HDV00_004383 [Rhizophlyctis rosea]|nr:hypothetical protein HDV00_004383 [Rhizophlyctis rosea]
MDLHLTLHAWEIKYKSSPSRTHDPHAHAVEKDFAFMKRNVDHLKQLAEYGIQTYTSDQQLKLDPQFLTIHYNEVLGGGGFSKVYGGTYQGKRVAVKHVFRVVSVDVTAQEGMSEEERFQILMNEVRREAAILHRLQPSPHTIAVFGVCVKDKKACLVMEPASTSLAGKLCSQTLFTWQEKMILLRDIALALNYMHSCLFIHRDLKPANILIDDNGHARIADVGGSASTVSIAIRPTVYTPEYTPSVPVSSFSSDIYAFGKVLEKISQGYMPPALELQDSNIGSQPSYISDASRDASQPTTPNTERMEAAHMIAFSEAQTSTTFLEPSKIRYGAKLADYFPNEPSETDAVLPPTAIDGHLDNGDSSSAAADAITHGVMQMVVNHALSPQSEEQNTDPNMESEEKEDRVAAAMRAGDKAPASALDRDLQGVELSDRVRGMYCRIRMSRA